MCVSAAGKIILVVVNIVFMIVGLAFVAAGSILAFLPGTVLKDAYDEAKDAASSQGYSIVGSEDDLEDFPLLYEIGIALFVFGILLFALSFLGCCGACCATCCRYLLLIFAIAVIVMMIAEIAIACLFLIDSSQLHTEIKDQVKDQITDKYDDDGGDAFSSAINILNHYYKCCGMDGVQDFGAKEHRSCEAAYEQVGCYTKLQDDIDDNKTWIGLVLGGLLGLQLLEVICAIYIFKNEIKILPI